MLRLIGNPVAAGLPFGEFRFGRRSGNFTVHTRS